MKYRSCLGIEATLEVNRINESNGSCLNRHAYAFSQAFNARSESINFLIEQIGCDFIMWWSANHTCLYLLELLWCMYYVTKHWRLGTFFSGRLRRKLWISISTEKVISAHRLFRELLCVFLGCLKLFFPPVLSYTWCPGSRRAVAAKPSWPMICSRGFDYALNVMSMTFFTTTIHAYDLIRTQKWEK